MTIKTIQGGKVSNVEEFSPEFLRKMCKKLSLRELKDLAKLLDEDGIEAFAQLIYGKE